MHRWNNTRFYHYQRKAKRDHNSMLCTLTKLAEVETRRQSIGRACSHPDSHLGALAGTFWRTVAAATRGEPKALQFCPLNTSRGHMWARVRSKRYIQGWPWRNTLCQSPVWIPYITTCLTDESRCWAQWVSFKVTTVNHPICMNVKQRVKLMSW